MLFPAHSDTRYPYTADGAPMWSPETPWPDSWCLISAMAAGGAEAKRAFGAMMEMKKIDVAKIKAARKG